MNQASVKHTCQRSSRYLALLAGRTSATNALSPLLRPHQAKRRLWNKMPAFNQLVHAWLMPSRGILRTFNNAGITRRLMPAGGKGRPVDLDGLPSYSGTSSAI
jgi:hypothetical protein